MPAKTEELLEKANRLPRSPGVYIMKNKRGQVVYVGKSKVLKNRVSQYFQRISDHAPKTAKMVSVVDDFSYILTDTEMEALTLENSLIKHYAPKYNIRLKDDKNYPYIRVSQEPWPTIRMVRKRGADKAKYYGPYTSAQTVYQLILAIQKIFATVRCNMKLPGDIGKRRPCIYAQIGGCIAPCTGAVSESEYQKLFSDIHSLLRGNTADVKKRLNEEMLRASNEMAFEKAAQLRDKLNLIGRIWEKQKVVSDPDRELDVFAYYSAAVCTCVSVFYVRSGILIDNEHQLFGADQLFEQDNIAQFLIQFYDKRGYIPHEILLDFALREEHLTSLSDYLSEKAGFRVPIRIPKRGESKGLCTMARENAEEHGKQYAADTERDNQTLIRLAQLLTLEVVPERIEAYDISNYGTEHITAGMVVMDHGTLQKKDYRTFSIKQTVKDDYGAMREAIARRMQHYLAGDNGFLPPPDLILLDGGIGHVHTIRTLLDEMQIDIPVFGMVKDDFHKTRVLTDGTHEISIANEQRVFVLIYKLQEEVHRYTITRMKNAKGKTIRKSSLEKIKGVGPQKAKALLAFFPTLADVRAASTETLEKVPGIPKAIAQNIYAYFHAENDTAPKYQKNGAENERTDKQ